MKIQADEEGKNVILSMIHKGMKGGAFDGVDAVPIAILQQSIKPLPEPEEKKESEDG